MRNVNPPKIDIEAFRPKPGEATLSFDVESLIEVPILEDHWSTHPTDPRGTCRILAQVPNQSNYPVIYDANPTVSHCGVTNTTALRDDDDAIQAFADNSELVFDPWK